MGTIYDAEKLNFYHRIGNDGTVQDFKAEEKIKNLTEKILRYTDHAELAINYIYNPKYAHYNKNAEKPQYVHYCFMEFDRAYYSDRLDDVRYISIDGRLNEAIKPQPIEFQDIEEIAYQGGIYKDSRNIAFRLLQSEHPLEPRLKKYLEGYELLKKWELSEDHLGKDITSFLRTHINVELSTELSMDSLDLILNKCCNYLNRNIKLLNLADLKETIFDYYFCNTENYTGEFTKKEIKWTAQAFEKQAEINGISFKTIFSTLLRSANRYKAGRRTEEIYNSIMRDHDKLSSARLNVSTGKKIPT